MNYIKEKINNKKGFTLIEILGVIIILAILSLVITPVIISIITNYKIKKYETDFRTYINAIEKLKIDTSIGSGNYEPLEGFYTLDDIPSDKINGQKAKQACFSVRDGVVQEAEININDYFYNYNKDKGIKYLAGKKGIICAPELFSRIKSDNSWDDDKIWQPQYLNKYKEIIFEDKIEVNPVNLVAEFDLSKNEDNSIMARIIKDTDGMYILKIQAKGGYVKASNLNRYFIMSDVTKITNMHFLQTDYVEDFSYLFAGMNKIKKLDLSKFVTSNAKYMRGMFLRTENLVELDISHFDTKNVIDMSEMFAYNFKLTSLNLKGFNTSNVQIMNNMFTYVKDLENLDLSSFDTKNVTNMFSMFSDMYSLKTINIKNFNTSKVTDMGSMFSNLFKLENLDVSNFDTSNLINASNMFNNCLELKELNVSHFNTSKVTDMRSMFSGMHKLESLDVSNFDTSKVTNMSYMFLDNKKLKSLNVANFNTSNLIDASHMFKSLYGLESLDISGWNLNKLKTTYQMFSNNKKLKYIKARNLNFASLNNYSFMFAQNPNLERIDFTNTIFTPVVSGSIGSTDAFKAKNGKVNVISNIPETKTYLLNNHDSEVNIIES